MKCREICRWVLLATLFCAADGRAEGISTRTLVDRGKEATALLLRDKGRKRASATAFCVGPEGLFLTSNHAVTELEAGEKLYLVLHANEANEKRVEARVIRGDEDTDLALLKVKAPLPKGLVPLAVADSDELYETLPVWTFGFPFGEDLATEEGRVPSISVTVGRVTSLRKKEGMLDKIQLDASLNPGNSGGPILNAEGKVVGVVSSGIYGSGVNFGVPANRLRAFFRQPVILFNPPAISSEVLSEPTRFEMQAVALASASPEYTARLVLTYMDNSTVAVLRPKGETYSARAPVCSESLLDRVRVAAEFPDGRVVCQCQDQVLQVGERSIRLSRIHKVDPAEQKVMLWSGEQLDGPVRGLDRLPLDLGAVTLGFPLSKATRISFERVALERAASYRLEVREGEEVVYTQEGHIAVTGLEGGNASSPGHSLSLSRTGTKEPLIPIREAPVEGLREAPLPGLADDFDVGGGGRFLVLSFPALRKLGVFDVNVARIVRFIPAKGGQIEFTAGRTKLIIALTDERIIQRWNLLTGKKELTTTLPFSRVGGMAMGSDTDERFLLAGDLPDSREHLYFLSARTLRPEQVSFSGSWVDSASAEVRASADGMVYGEWKQGNSEVGSVVLAANAARGSRLNEDRDSHALPSPDGRVIHTARNVYTPAFVPLQVPSRGADFVIPATRGNYYLSAKQEVRRESSEIPIAYVQISLYIRGYADPLVHLKPICLGPVGSRGRPYGREFPRDRAYHLFPEAKLLVIVPPARNRLILKRLDVEEVLSKSGMDYLFVVSSPPPKATRGRLLEYQISTKSKRGGVTYELEGGPEGMKLSERGRLSWYVPTSLEEEAVSVIVLVADRSGQQVYHTFTCDVE